ncbi:MAG TPA: COX15/CtaA family protein [Pyrinomonadaceae bacterium]|nr:COX15/CtaA family protein [Pyrinomonadaceae bacterium]
MEHTTHGSRRFAAFAWAVLAFNLLVILWGAYVRATGSGAGCGDHWPLCNGVVVPDAPEVKTVIEFTHRLTSGLALLLVVALVAWAFRSYSKGHAVRRGAVLSLVFILVEALIGAGLVLLQLVADDASVARAAYLSVHLVNTFVLVAVLALTAWWASAGEAPRWRESPPRLRRHVVAALAATLALGVSGAVAALGATLFPESAAEVARRDLSAPAQLLFSLRHYKLHPALAAAVGAYLIAFAVAVRRKRPGAWAARWARAVVALVLVQTAAGLINAALLAPVWLQIVHLLLADLLWLALVLLSATALSQAEAQAEGARSGAALGQAVGV